VNHSLVVESEEKKFKRRSGNWHNLLTNLNAKKGKRTATLQPGDVLIGGDNIEEVTPLTDEVQPTIKNDNGSLSRVASKYATVNHDPALQTSIKDLTQQINDAKANRHETEKTVVDLV
jgi:hypothetical protein